jgi:hypothetical protein
MPIWVWHKPQPSNGDVNNYRPLNQWENNSKIYLYWRKFMINIFPFQITTTTAPHAYLSMVQNRCSGNWVDTKHRTVFVSAPNMIPMNTMWWRVVCGSEMERQGSLIPLHLKHIVFIGIMFGADTKTVRCLVSTQFPLHLFWIILK